MTDVNEDIERGTDGPEGKPESEEPKKPSIISQLIPYVFTAAILAYVFTGLSSSVVDERHSLKGTEWSDLVKTGLRKKSIEIKSPSGDVTYCGPESEVSEECPAGPDYEVRAEEEGIPAGIRRSATSRIGDGAEVSVNYVVKVKLSEMYALVKEADWRLYLPFIILHSLIFMFADVSSFGFAYRWFNVPGMKLKEILEVRLAPYVIQIGIPPLAEVLFPLYMWRVKKAPVTKILSSNFWAMLTEVLAIFTSLTIASYYNVFVNTVVEAIGVGWVIVCTAFWVIFFSSIIFWHTSRGKRLKASIAQSESGEGNPTGEGGIKETIGGSLYLLRTFSMARWHHWLRAYGARMILQASGIISSYMTLKALGVEPSIALAGIAFPIIILSVFMPISVGGYGGAQLVAWFLIVKMGQTGTADQVIAFSLLWSTGFLVGRAIIGLVFIRGFWKRCFPNGFSLSG